MRKIVVRKPGSYDRLQIETHPDPRPGDDEIVIEVEAIGINYADCVTRMGLYASARRYVGYPITPGFEAAGRVTSVGGQVRDLRVGDPVMAVTRFGGYTTHLCVKRNQVFAVPLEMDMGEAAAFPTAFLTAWFGLFELAHAHPGDTLLVHSAAGGVGGALVQLGKIAACRVIGVVGNSHKVATATELGADAIIEKSTQPLWPSAERYAPAGYDVILDANGVATLRGSYAHLAPVGRLVIYGFHSMLPRSGGRPRWLKLAWAYLRTPCFNPLKLTVENRSVLGFNLSFLFNRSALLHRAMQQLLQWRAEGQIRAPRLTSYPFDAVAEAHRELESGQTSGKLILRV